MTICFGKNIPPQRKVRWAILCHFTTDNHTVAVNDNSCASNKIKLGMEGDENIIEARFESDGYYGTIRFKGQVAGTKDEWYGVEWDDPTRGKHDGTHGDKKYFSTSHPTSGSFLRPRKANLGIPFMQALKERYGIIDADLADRIHKDMFVVGHGQRTTVEVVGIERLNKQQSKFDELVSVALRGMCVNSPGKEGEIAHSIPNIEELDISSNLLSSWEDVAGMVQQLPKLTSLNVSQNKLVFPRNSSQLAAAFNNIKTIYLNRMNYTWNDVIQCCEMFPNLLELHACFNNISSLGALSDNLLGLKRLNLEHNAITSWQELLVAGQLPNLEELIVNNTGLDEVKFPDATGTQRTKYFPRLTTLALSHNKIHSLDSVNALGKLASLTDLKINHNALSPAVKKVTNVIEATAEYTLWYLIIAKIHNLKRLNKTLIKLSDQQGAELDYLKMFGQAWLKLPAGPSQEREQFDLAHPRYEELVQIYGPPEEAECKQDSAALKNKLLSMKIDSPYLPHKAPIKKKLPVSMSVQKLKTLLSRIYKVSTISMTLTYTSQKMPDTEFEFENDQKEIGFYSVEDGDTIHVKWGHFAHP
ncbi:Tubulin-specific chaperone E [Lamellibrachia satsuma]|nr:Tubulin-specific chaperone E [Lamellibrachia satsuma]